MCIAASGQLIEKEGNRGKVNIRGNILPVELSAVKANPGDYILVHAGCAISVISQEESDELAALLKEISENGRS